MTLIIAAENPLSTESLELIEGSEAALRELYTAEECFSLEPAELATDNVTFFVARKDGLPLGCIALSACDGYAEIKRLFVTPAARGSGAGIRLVEHLETAAAKIGLSLIRLESGHKLAAAVALYEKMGYTKRGPFGGYSAHPASLFMEKQL